MSILVQANNLSKNYRNVKALSNVSFSLNTGIWGLIGPNGAGKTTLLNLIWGLIHPSSGGLTVLGSDPNSDNLQVKRDLGVCFTSQNFPSNYLCKDYLIMVASAYNTPQAIIKPLIQYLSKELHFESVWEKEINHLSSGMKQKLAIIQCLIGFPTIAIMDEPFANLDPLAKEKVKKLVLEYHKTLGTSFLISSHSLEDLEALSSGYIFIGNGQLLWRGLSDEIPQKNLLEFYLDHVKKTLI